MKITRHLQRKHEDEGDVSHAVSSPVGSKKEKEDDAGKAFAMSSNWQHDLRLFKGGYGEIVTWKRPCAEASANDYLPCQHCNALFKRAGLWRHEKTRRVEGEKTKKRRMRKAKDKRAGSTEQRSATRSAENADSGPQRGDANVKIVPFIVAGFRRSTSEKNRKFERDTG